VVHPRRQTHVEVHVWHPHARDAASGKRKPYEANLVSPWIDACLAGFLAAKGEPIREGDWSADQCLKTTPSLSCKMTLSRLFA
jgi:hypothetical protein